MMLELPKDKDANILGDIENLQPVTTEEFLTNLYNTNLILDNWLNMDEEACCMQAKHVALVAELEATQRELARCKMEHSNTVAHVRMLYRELLASMESGAPMTLWRVVIELCKLGKKYKFI